MTDYRIPRRQATDHDYWWPEPEAGARAAAGYPGRQEQIRPRPAATFHQEAGPGPTGNRPHGRPRPAQDRPAQDRPTQDRPRPTEAAGSAGSSPGARTPRRPVAPQPSARTDLRAGAPRRDRVGAERRRPGATTPPRKRPAQSAALALAGTTPLTSFGVSAVLAGACVIGGALDLLLVSTAAWAITGLFLAASGYAATKVHRAHWYSAIVGPPLAFAIGLLFVAQFSPERTGPGFTGTLTTILTLLAMKARTVYAGTILALCIVLARRLPFNR